MHLDESQKVIDMQNRNGSVSLHEVLMTKRADVAKFLLEKHDADMDIEEALGLSPRKMLIGSSIMMDPEVNRVMQRNFVRRQKKQTKLHRNNAISVVSRVRSQAGVSSVQDVARHGTAGKNANAPTGKFTKSDVRTSTQGLSYASHSVLVVRPR